MPHMVRCALDRDSFGSKSNGNLLVCRERWLSFVVYVCLSMFDYHDQFVVPSYDVMRDYIDLLKLARDIFVFQ